MDFYLRQIYKNWQVHNLANNNKDHNRTILYIEPNSFFLNLTVPVLKNENFSVVNVENLSDGENYIENGEGLGCVLLDLDHDLERAKELLQLIHEKDEQIYVIGLTSLEVEAMPDDLLESGMSEIISKLDRMALVETLTMELTSSNSEAA